MDINKSNNNFQEKLGITKYMWMFYYLMCPKTRSIHLNLYKSNNIPIPEYLDENKLMNNSNSNINELKKLTININKKYINQKYLEFITKKFNVENFDYKSQFNYNNIIIILLIILIIYGIFRKFF
jgi:hypothetical protein